MDTGRAFCWKFISAAKSVAWWWAGGWPVGSAIKQIGEDAGNIRMRILTVNYLGLGRRRPTGRVMGRGRWPSNCHMEMVVKGAAAAGPGAKMKPGMTVILPTERDGRIVPGY